MNWGWPQCGKCPFFPWVLPLCLVFELCWYILTIFWYIYTANILHFSLSFCWAYGKFDIKVKCQTPNFHVASAAFQIVRLKALKLLGEFDVKVRSLIKRLCINLGILSIILLPIQSKDLYSAQCVHWAVRCLGMQNSAVYDTELSYCCSVSDTETSKFSRI